MAVLPSREQPARPGCPGQGRAALRPVPQPAGSRRSLPLGGSGAARAARRPLSVRPRGRPRSQLLTSPSPPRPPGPRPPPPSCAALGDPAAGEHDGGGKEGAGNSPGRRGQSEAGRGRAPRWSRGRPSRRVVNVPGAAGSATKATAGRRAKPRVSGWRVTPGSARRSTRRTGSAASSFGRVDAHSRRQPWLLWGSRHHGRGVPGRPLTTRPSTRGARATRPARREIVGRGEEQPGAPRLHRPRPLPRRSVLRGTDPPSGRGEPQTGAVWAPRVPGAPAAALGEHTVLCCCQRQPPKRAEAASACQALAPLPAGGSLWARPGRAGHRTPGKVLLLGSLP